MNIIKIITNTITSMQVLCWICAVFIVLFYNYLYSFSFLPITEGWFTVYGKLINNGMIPYRDFYLYLTPFYPLFIGQFIEIFGDSFFALRLLGFLVTLLITSLLFFILSKRFKPIPAMFASIICMFYYQSGVAYISYDFTQFLTLLTLASLLMLTIVGDTKSEDFKNVELKIILCLILAGLFASLAFLTKQSNGSMVLIASGISSLYIVYFNHRSNLKIFVYYLLGVSIPFVTIFIWLYSENSLGSFFSQIFTDALSVKGDLGSILFSWIKNSFNNIFFVQMKTASIWFLKLFFTSLLTYYIFKKINFLKKLKYEYLYVFFLTSLAFLSVLNSYYDYLSFNDKIIVQALHYNNYIIPITLSAIIIIFLLSLASVIFKKLPIYIKPNDIIILIFSTGMIFGNGTSAGLSEISIFLFLGYALSYLMSSNFFKIPGTAIVLYLGLSFIFTFSSKKFNSPYAWWGIDEPDVRIERSYSNIELFKNLHLSKASNIRLESINKILVDYGDNKSIFAFPNIPIIYLLADNLPKSKVVISWFDFLPDKRATEESFRIMNNNPDVIVNLLLPEIAWSVHERLFRDNMRLGQRDILDVINDLTLKKSLYNLEFSEELSNDLILQVWTKK